MIYIGVPWNGFWCAFEMHFGKLLQGQFDQFIVYSELSNYWSELWRAWPSCQRPSWSWDNFVTLFCYNSWPRRWGASDVTLTSHIGQLSRGWHRLTSWAGTWWHNDRSILWTTPSTIHNFPILTILAHLSLLTMIHCDTDLGCVFSVFLCDQPRRRTLNDCVLSLVGVSSGPVTSLGSARSPGQVGGKPRPIRAQYWGHATCPDQSEDSIESGE